MNQRLGRKWENACIKTRRSLFMRKRRLVKFGIKASDRVLDLGCGDGLDIMILNKLGVKKTVGLDLSEDLLGLARKNNPGVKFFQADSESLPFKNKTFDVVLADSFFHHLEDYDKTIGEIKRVLVPKGRLCFIEPHASLMRSFFDFITKLSISRWLPFFKERRRALFGEKKLMSFWLKDERLFLKKLEENGFKKISVKNDILSILGSFVKH